MMNNRHRKTLEAVFRNPISTSIVWDDIESLLVACQCRTIEGNGSSVGFEKDGILLRMHRPHPVKEAKRYQVRDAREFLIKIGITP
ncbi:type II toxin-antitoxin system HicA family toxin [Rhizobium sp.]